MKRKLIIIVLVCYSYAYSYPFHGSLPTAQSVVHGAHQATTTVQQYRLLKIITILAGLAGATNGIIESLGNQEERPTMFFIIGKHAVTYITSSHALIMMLTSATRIRWIERTVRQAAIAQHILTGTAWITWLFEALASS